MGSPKQVEGEQGWLFKIIATKTKQQKACHSEKTSLCMYIIAKI